MSAFTAISSMIELAVIIFLIYGFYKEDKFIAFEQKVKMIIVVNYRRYKRKKRIEQMRKNREFKLAFLYKVLKQEAVGIIRGSLLFSQSLNCGTRMDFST